MQVYKWMTILILALFFILMELGFSKFQKQMTLSYTSQQIQLYNTELLDIGQTIQQNELKNSAIKVLIGKISSIKNYAQNCTVNKQNQLNSLNQLVSQLDLDKNTPIPSNLKNQFQTEEKNLIDDISHCQLISYEAAKQINLANNTMLANEDNPKFKSIFELAHTPGLFKAGDLKFKDEKNIFGLWNSSFYLQALELLITTLIISILISKLILNYAKTLVDNSQKYILKYFAFILPLISSIFSVWLLMFNNTKMLKTPPPIVNIMYFIVVFIVLKFVCDIYLNIIYKEQINNTQWTNKVSRYINYIFLTMFFNLAYSFVVRDLLDISNTSIFLIKCANLISFAFWVEWLLLFKAFNDKKFRYHARFKYFVTWASFVISSIYALRIATSLLQINPTIDNFISNTTLKICTIGLVIYLTFFLNQSLILLEDFVLTHPFMRKWFVFGKFQGLEIWEFHIIRVCLVGLFLIISNSYLFVILGLPDNFIDAYNGFFFNGIKIAQINFAPCTILYSSITFCLFTLIGKSTAFHIASQTSLEEETDKKNTIERSFRYLFYILAFIITMYIWGIKIQELYYVMGAVGLGIGIGLKSLVLDAISGILILFIKPVHIGDYITIMARGKEKISGYVQQIDFLSTQIISQHSNITRVPNGILFNEFIINFSNFQANSHGYLTLTLKNINDFSQCREIMLEVAEEYKEIIHASYKKPTVSFDFLENEQGQELAVINLSFHVKRPENKMFVYQSLEKQIIAKLNEKGIKVIESKENKIFI